MSKRIVGWFDRLELKQVYEGLYADDEASRRYAINRVAVWKARVLHKLPTAVECTCDLVLSQMFDHQVTAEGSLQTHSREVRLQYSMAVIRFVTLITENKQTGVYAQPIHMLASIQGLPSWLVDMRHNASHSSLPALPVLRRAAQEALSWLQANYWEEQLVDIEENICPKSQVLHDSDAANILVDYMQHMFGYLNEESMKKKKSTKKDYMRNVLRPVESALHMNANREVFFTILCTKGYLDPTDEQLKALDFHEEANETRVPPVLIDLWKPLLKTVDKCGCIVQLLTHLVKSLSHSSDVKPMAWISAWVYTLLAAVSTQKEIKKRWNVTKLVDPPKNTDKTALLRTILAEPRPHSSDLFKHFMDCFPDCIQEKSQREHVKRLLQIMVNPKDNSASEVPGSHLSLEQLQGLVGQRMTLSNGTKEGQSTNNHTVWELDTAHDWRSHMLGGVPTCPLTYTSLKLPDEVDGIHIHSRYASVSKQYDGSKGMDIQPQTCGSHPSDITMSDTRELEINGSEIGLL